MHLLRRGWLHFSQRFLGMANWLLDDVSRTERIKIWTRIQV